ncbi:MAG: phosphohydrolase [Micropruina sp.]
MNMETVAQIARNAHAGQVDKAGRDYVDGHLRPIAQAAAVFGEEAEAAAWLHDTIEDTPTTADELLGLGVPQRVVAAVQSVTRLDGEPYEELIGRAGAHPCGRYVKLADNAWNITCNPALAATRPDWAERMLRERYQPARARLLAACGLVPDSDVVRRMQAVLDRHYARLVPRA